VLEVQQLMRGRVREQARRRVAGWQRHEKELEKREAKAQSHITKPQEGLFPKLSKKDLSGK